MRRIISHSPSFPFISLSSFRSLSCGHRSIHSFPPNLSTPPPSPPFSSPSPSFSAPSSISPPPSPSSSSEDHRSSHSQLQLYRLIEDLSSDSFSPSPSPSPSAPSSSLSSSDLRSIHAKRILKDFYSCFRSLDDCLAKHDLHGLMSQSISSLKHKIPLRSDQANFYSLILTHLLLNDHDEEATNLLKVLLNNNDHFLPMNDNPSESDFMFYHKPSLFYQPFFTHFRRKNRWRSSYAMLVNIHNNARLNEVPHALSLTIKTLAWSYHRTKDVERDEIMAAIYSIWQLVINNNSNNTIHHFNKMTKDCEKIINDIIIECYGANHYKSVLQFYWLLQMGGGKRSMPPHMSAAVCEAIAVSALHEGKDDIVREMISYSDKIFYGAQSKQSILNKKTKDIENDRSDYRLFYQSLYHHSSERGVLDPSISHHIEKTIAALRIRDEENNTNKEINIETTL